MHVRCIAKDALERARKPTPVPNQIFYHPANHLLKVGGPAAHDGASDASRPKGKLKNPANNPNLTAVADASRSLTTAEVFIKGQPDRLKVEAAEEDEIVITTENGEQHSEEVCCLFCGSQVD